VYQCGLVLRTDKTIQYAQFIEQNKINIESNKEYYKRRQAIVEHPYGIIKRQWGFLLHHDKKRQEKGQGRCRIDVHSLQSTTNQKHFRY